MKYFYLLIVVFISYFSNGQLLDAVLEESVAAHRSKDYGRFLSLTKKALQLHPSQPKILYNLAAGHSLNDSLKTAYQTLKKLLSWDVRVSYKEDTDFENFLVSTRYGNSLDSLKGYYERKNKLSTQYANFGNKRHLEDLVLLDTLLFVTDVFNSELVKYNIQSRQIARVRKFDLSVMAITSGFETNSIWVSTARILQSEKKGASLNKPEILEIDVLDGSTKSRIVLEDEFIAGSMILCENGKLYVSNSSKPQIAIIDTSTNRVEHILDVKDGFNLQGITVDLSNNFLFVSDYIKGIARIDIANDYQIGWLKSNDYLLKGIDGLTFMKDGQLLAVQNNSTPQKVIKIQIEDLEIKSVTLLDNDLDFTGEPTNGKYYEKLGFLYVANSPWPHYDESGKPIFENWEEQTILLINNRALKID